MVGELLKNMLDEEGDYKPVDGPEIGSLILIDRGEYQTAEFDCFVLSTIYDRKKEKKERNQNVMWLKATIWKCIIYSLCMKAGAMVWQGFSLFCQEVQVYDSKDFAETGLHIDKLPDNAFLFNLNFIKKSNFTT